MYLYSKMGFIMWQIHGNKIFLDPCSRRAHLVKHPVYVCVHTRPPEVLEWASPAPRPSGPRGSSAPGTRNASLRRRWPRRRRRPRPRRNHLRRTKAGRWSNRALTKGPKPWKGYSSDVGGSEILKERRGKKRLKFKQEKSNENWDEFFLPEIKLERMNEDHLFRRTHSWLIPTYEKVHTH